MSKKKKRNKIAKVLTFESFRNAVKKIREQGEFNRILPVIK